MNEDALLQLLLFSSLLVDFDKNPPKAMLDKRPRPRKISKVQKIALQRNISAHELAKNILTEAGYKIVRQETPVLKEVGADISLNILVK